MSRLKILLALIAALPFLVSCCGLCAGTEPIPRSIETPTVMIGTPARSSNWEVTVTGKYTRTNILESVTGGGSVERNEPDSIFVVVPVTVVNVGKEADDLSPDQVKIIDSEGRAFTFTCASRMNGRSFCFFYQAVPGVPYRADLAFDVDPQAKGLKLLIKGDLGQTTIIHLESE